MYTARARRAPSATRPISWLSSCAGSGAAARRLGRRRLRGVAFVEDAAPLDGYSEVPRLVAAFRGGRHPRRAGHRRPSSAVTRGGVRLRDMAVDVVYRDLALEDLGTPAGPARSTASSTASMPARSCRAWRASSARRGCSSSRAPRGRRASSRPPSAGSCARGAVDPRPRGSADGGSSRAPDRPAGVRAARAGAPPHQAERGLERGRACSSAGRRAPPVGGADRPGSPGARPLGRPGAPAGDATARALPPGGRAHAGPCYFSLGLFYAPGDLGLHVRVSREPVVNVARQGAVACAFLTAP